MATRSAKPPRLRGLQEGHAQSYVLGDAVECHGGHDGEPRDIAPDPSCVTIEQLVRRHEGRRASQEPYPGEQHAAGPERLLKQIEGERGNERAAGEGQHHSNQPSRRPPVRSNDAPYHQGAGRDQAEEKGVQHRGAKEASLIHPHTVPASGIAAPQSRSCLVVEESSSATIETRLSTQLGSTPRSCEISSVDIPERRRFSTSSSRQTSPLLSKTHASRQRLTRLFIPARRLAFRDTEARIFLPGASPRCTYLDANNITLRVRLSPDGRQEVRFAG